MKKKKEKNNDKPPIDGSENGTKRKFDDRNCINPNCKYFPVYMPKRNNQKYCCVQCQIDAANDRAQEKNRTKYRDEKLLRLYDKRLQRLYSFFVKDGVAQVHIEFFRYENVDLSKLVQQQTNSDTEQPIRWFYEYGTERHPSQHDWFRIHFRTKTQKI